MCNVTLLLLLTYLIQLPLIPPHCLTHLLLTLSSHLLQLTHTLLNLFIFLLQFLLVVANLLNELVLVLLELNYSLLVVLEDLLQHYKLVLLLLEFQNAFSHLLVVSLGGGDGVG